MKSPESSPPPPRTGPGSGGLRQSMAWLHTWTGLLVGWVLFFMFVTGTFGYVNAEVDRWMKPELPLPAPPPPAAKLLPLAEARLRAVAPDAEAWSIHFPGLRGSDQLTVAWRLRPVAPATEGEEQRETLELRSGQPVQPQVRETGGGDALYRMHYRLHYLPESWARYIVGVCALVMLVALVSGVLVHKKLFKDFFTFRPGKGQRSWLDGHNLLSVSALPFHVMITWSGLLFFLFTYLPAPRELLYPTEAAQQRFEREAYGRSREPAPPRSAADTPAPLAPLAQVLAQSENEWGKDHRLRSIDVREPGRASARVTARSYRPTVVGPSWAELRLDGVTGQVLGATGPEQNPVEVFRRTLFNLHEGHFAPPLLRLLYVLSALAATAMIGTGLLLWSSKRKARLRPRQPLGTALLAVDVLNAGTLVGLPIGVAAYFWANRLLPVGLPGRAEGELHALFLTWAGCYALALWRARAGVWSELCWVAAAAYGALPLLNALSTDRHLAVTIPAGDWVVAGFDLCALGLGVFFAFLAQLARKKASSAAARGAAVLQSARLPAPEVA